MRQLRLQLKQRDVLVDQLHGDVAALKVRELPCIVCDSAMHEVVQKELHS